jgi:V8-like Glu-specific endopeptidase
MDPTPISPSALPQVGLVRASFPSTPGQLAISTGTLIHRRVILTAGHVVFDWSRGDGTTGYPRRVTVTFGGTITVPANVFRVAAEWITSTNSDPNSMDPLSPYDVGAILLDASVASQLASLPLAKVAQTSMADLRNVGVAVTGYSAAALGSLYWGSSVAEDMGSPYNEYRVAYATNSLAGMSGGPVYTMDAVGTIYVRAVNTASYQPGGGNPMGNGLLIYPAVAQLILNWVSQVL